MGEFAEKGRQGLFKMDDKELERVYKGEGAYTYI